MTDNKKISNNLKTLREERGLKQNFVASRLGITQNYYSQIENGHRPPQTKHLLILRDLFGVSLDEIFFKGEFAKRDSEQSATKEAI
jgi:transcriptional regulator with XRE-family HTH domain